MKSEEWVQVKPGIFRKHIGKKEFEYKYRVKQKDGVGITVDTIHRLNNRGNHSALCGKPRPTVKRILRK